MTTTVKLTPEAAVYAEEKLKTGAFASLDDLVNAALIEQAQRDAEYQEWAHAHIQTALDEVRAGRAKYASIDVVEAWVNSWATDEESPKPLCA